MKRNTPRRQNNQRHISACKKIIRAGLNIVVMVDEAIFSSSDPNFCLSTWPKSSTAEYSVCDALRNLGHRVMGMPISEDITLTIERLKVARPDLIFNLVEEIGGRRELDSIVPRLLEIQKIPYTGATADVLTLARNKYLSKLVVAAAGVHVPKGFPVFGPGDLLKHALAFPAFVKPLALDGSEGVTDASYINNRTVLRGRKATLFRRGPILWEEYAPGRELIVTISGTKKVSIDSICELVFPKTAPVQFATEQAKFNAKYRKRTGIYYRTPASVDQLTMSRVSKAAIAAYRALKIDAYAKLEFRVTKKHVTFIEANPNSVLSRTAKSSDFTSIGYDNFISKIIEMAMERVP